MANLLNRAWSDTVRFGAGVLGVAKSAASTVTPVGIAKNSANVAGKLVVNTKNRFLGFIDGKDKHGNFSLINSTVRLALVIGLIGFIGKTLKNWLNRVDLKEKTDAVKMDTEALEMRTKAAKLHALADYVEVNGHLPGQEPQSRADFSYVDRYAPGGPKQPAYNLQPRNPANSRVEDLQVQADGSYAPAASMRQ